MPGRQRRDKRGAPGLYRSWKRNRKTGKLEASGAYVIEINIPKRLRHEFAGIKPRLKRSTEVFPGTKNAAVIVEEMKMMVDDIFFRRDAALLRRLENNEVSLGTLYAKWKSGRIHLVEPHENKLFVKEWRAYLDRSNLANRTRVNRKAVIDSLLRKELISDKDVLAQIPERLAAMRQYYEKSEQHSAFNTYRMEILTFLTKGLGFHDDSQLLSAASRVKQLPQQKGRPHHPFPSPREMAALCAQIKERDTPLAALYVYSVQFMCLHGLRPEEFDGKKFRVDPKTNHLKIDGTKNENADRLAPRLMEVDQTFRPPRTSTLNRMLERMGVAVRCRDFRRTYALWVERAGILPSHYRQYIGHGETSVTHIYQRIIPSAEQMDADATKLLAWVDDEMKKPTAKRQQPEVLTAMQRYRMSGSDLRRLINAAAKDEREVRRSRREHHEE